MTPAIFIAAFLLSPGIGETTITRSEIQSVAEQFIRSRILRSHAEMTVEFRSVPDQLTIRGDSHEVRVPESVTDIRAGNFSLPVELLADGRVGQHCIVSVKVRTYDSVLIATRQLGRHENLTSEDVRKERVETTSLRSEALTRTEQLEGVRTSRILSSGTVLTSDLTEPVPLVAQGSPVVLIVRGHSVMFSTDAIARQDGMKGDRIMVQRTGSSARLHAEVVDAGTVQMIIQ